MIGEGGVAGDEDLALELFVRLDALQAICATPNMTEQSAATDLRHKYQEMLSIEP